MCDTLQQIIAHLEQMQTLHHEIAEAGLTSRLAELQAWQCDRLLLSHQALWQQKKFKPAMQFFIEELYGPEDFTQRDADIARVVPKMAGLLPDKAMNSLESALHLNALSLSLDYLMIQALGDEPISRDSYAQAYRKCNNYTSRQQQLSFIENLGQDLADVIHIKGISTLLMLSKTPAKVAGLLSLHEFLAKGYKAFKKLGDVDEFIVPIITIERQLMDQLYSDPQINPLPENC